MPTIALASNKGGCGKTTASVGIATELMLQGNSVALLDCDPNGHAARTLLKFNKHQDAAGGPTVRVVGDVTENSIFDEIKAARECADFVVLDLPGVGSKLTLKALTKAHLIIIPVQPSEMDAIDGAKTAMLVREAEETIERPLEARYLLSRWPVLSETVVARHTRKALEATGIPLLRTPLMDRTGFKEMTYSGKPPRLVDPKGNGAGNLTAITNDVLAALDDAVARRTKAVA